MTRSLLRLLTDVKRFSNLLTDQIAVQSAYEEILRHVETIFISSALLRTDSGA